MSDAQSYREANKAKARRMCEPSSEKVDASDLPADYAFEGGKQNQPYRPKPRAYASGGCVEGSKSKHAGMSVRVGNKSGNYEGGTRPTGGRIARKHGGKAAKGKTNINIIIGTGEKAPNQPPPPPQNMPIRPPGMAMPQPAPGAGAPMAPPPGAMAGMPGMPRKSGGRTYKSMTAGAGSGEGRLEKVEIQKSKD